MEECLKKYKVFITRYNIIKNDYEIIEKIIETSDIYHEIGYIYCTTFEEIKSIRYFEISSKM